MARLRTQLFITVRNPFLEQAGRHHGGNKMAMGNIRERLALHFESQHDLRAARRPLPSANYPAVPPVVRYTKTIV